MPATHKSTTYKPLGIPNPLLQGQDKAYGDLLLDEKKRSKFHMRFNICSLVLFAVTLGLFYYAISMQTTIPVLINVLPSGEASYLGEVRQSGVELQIPEAAITFQIRKFITNIRSISVDSQVLYTNINECYSMITSTYEPIMTRMLRANSPFALVGKIRRSVEIESILRITGNSYQVDWIETSIEPGGSSPANLKMRGLVTIKLIPPEPSFIKNNPLGIFIEACEWTQL